MEVVLACRNVLVHRGSVLNGISLFVLSRIYNSQATLSPVDQQVPPERPHPAEGVPGAEQKDGEAAPERGLGRLLGRRKGLPAEGQRGAEQAVALTTTEPPHKTGPHWESFNLKLHRSLVLYKKEKNIVLSD